MQKQARNLLGEHLDQKARRHILFLDREDVLNLVLSTNLPVPINNEEDAANWNNDDIPF